MTPGVVPQSESTIIGCTPKGSYGSTALLEGFREDSGKGSAEGFCGRVLGRVLGRGPFLLNNRVPDGLRMLYDDDNDGRLVV